MSREEIRTIVRSHMDGRRSADPHTVVEAVFQTLTRKQRDEIAMYGLHEMVLEENRSSRNLTNLASSPEQNSKRGKSRWDAAKMRESYKIGNRWMWLEDCGADDLIKLAEQYEADATAYAAKAFEFRELATKLKKSKCKTVRELAEKEGVPA